MKQLFYLYFFCGVSINTFSQCSPMLSLASGSSFISESPPTFPTNRVGLDYASSELIIGGTGNITMNITNTNGCSNWQLYVSRVDNTSNTGLSFWVNKVNDGGITPPPGAIISPNGVTAPQLITGSPLIFFSGVKDRYLIQINYKIDGISVLKTASTYVTYIYYTISGTL